MSKLNQDQIAKLKRINDSLVATQDATTSGSTTRKNMMKSFLPKVKKIRNGN